MRSQLLYLALFVEWGNSCPHLSDLTMRLFHSKCLLYFLSWSGSLFVLLKCFCHYQEWDDEERKKPSRGEDFCSQLLEKLFLHSHSWWGLSTHHFSADFNNVIQLMPLCSFSDCPFSVCSSQEFCSDWWIFAGFQGTWENRPLFRAGSSGLCSGTLAGENAGFDAQQFGLWWHMSPLHHLWAAGWVWTAVLMGVGTGLPWTGSPPSVL